MAEGDTRHSAAGAGRRRRWLLGIVVLVLLAAGAGFAALRLDGNGSDRPDPRRDPAAVAPPAGLELPEPAPATPVAAPLGSAPVDPAAVRRALAGLLDDPRLGPRATVAVGPVGAIGTEPAYVAGPDVVTPASTLKLLTAVAALEALGPETTFATRTVRTGARLGLVGGGDPLLDGEDLDDLATATAAELTAADVRRVTLTFDTSLFTGPAVSPHWEPDYVTDDVVSPVTALWVDRGREASGLEERSADPALAAATVFAARLEQHGVEVFGAPRPALAPTTADPVAEVRGAEVAELVQHLLETSDNEATEVLARHVALAEGADPSFAAAPAALLGVAARLGVRTEGAVLRDASGLARGDRLPVRTLLDLLGVAADPARPELSSALAGLPVAGWTGSLRERFTGLDASPPAAESAPLATALGAVRAKTGTLTGVHGLAGVVTGRDGTPMAFVALLDRVPVEATLLARDRLDRVGAALAGCACQDRPPAP